MNKKYGVLIALIVAVVLFVFFNGHEYLSLAVLKNSQVSLASWQSENSLLFAVLFFTSYVVVTALSLPGAAVMTLAAGAFFGLGLGVLIVSFASSIGASCAFAVARYLFRESIQQRYAQRLKAINEGVRREGLFYLFSLRLIPVFPFFLVNLVMALTPLRLRDFYWVSQLGMLPATAVYVNAGVQLAELDSVSGVLSPALLISFSLLAVFPLLAKRFIESINRRKVYKPWSKPKKFDRNVIVLGGGAAGLVTSYIAAATQAKVTLVEAEKMGGDCLNYGCVPSKAMISVAGKLSQYKSLQNLGLDVPVPKINSQQLMAAVDSAIADIAPHDSVERYTELGVEVMQGYGRLIDPWTVEVAQHDGSRQRLSARSIVVASGAEPIVPALPGIDLVSCLTSNTLWDALRSKEELPQRLLILGGGGIGCELAQSFARLGCDVVQLEMLPRLMAREDEDVSTYIQAALEADGVRVLTGHKALRFENTAGQKLAYAVGVSGEEQVIPFDDMVCALGRRPKLAGFGLEELGIYPADGDLVNDYLETKYPNILLAGDVAGPYQFTHVAAHQAWYASVNALFGWFKKFKVDYSVIPWVSYVSPEVAKVGLNEQEAKAKGIAYELSRYDLSELDRAICEDAAQGFVKVLTVPGKDRILGVSIVGVHAGELIAEYVLAMRHGIGMKKILATIHSYPTLSEANKYAAGEWQKAHTPIWLLAVAARYHRWRRG